MRVGDQSLGYCLNVHPVRTWAELAASLRDYAAPVGRRVAGDATFGLGMWLPATVLPELRRDARPLRDLLAELNLSVFTFNGFPYGPFHGQSVKRRVYYPDWGDEARGRYTMALMEVLAELLPEGATGSISTVPVTYGKTLPAGAMAQLARLASHAQALWRRSGRRIVLALEPEPDCYLETSAETIDFMRRLYQTQPGTRDWVGVCFDTCHLVLQGEKLDASWDCLLAAGVPVFKVQVSSALYCDNRDGQAAQTLLSGYDEPVYLHQTRVWRDQRRLATYPDLGPALAANLPGEWLVHFHVPLPFTGHGALRGTSEAITPAFLARARRSCPHFEIETYSFGVMPGERPPLVDSLVAEFAWLLPRFRGAGDAP